MKNKRIYVAVLALNAHFAHAAGIDRSGQGLGPLFEQGNYLTASYRNIWPNVGGRDALGGETGSVLGKYGLAAFGLKADIDSRLSLGLVLDSPYGADLEYKRSSTMLGGTKADVATEAVLGLLRYRLDDRFSVHGGIRIQRADATVALGGLAYGAVSGYRLRLDPDTAAGWVGGVAYEVPETGLRLVATYHDRIAHELKSTETGAFAALNGSSTTCVTTPRAVNLDFRTGVAQDASVFGQVRWVNWSEFRVDPVRFVSVAHAGLIDIKDQMTYALGFGRQFTSRWSGALSVIYEKKEEQFNSPLSPTNGKRGLTAAATYRHDRFSISTALNYVRFGDAMLATGKPAVQRAAMSDNSAFGLALTLGYRFSP